MRYGHVSRRQPKQPLRHHASGHSSPLPCGTSGSSRVPHPPVQDDVRLSRTPLPTECPDPRRDDDGCNNNRGRRRSVAALTGTAFRGTDGMALCTNWALDPPATVHAAGLPLAAIMMMICRYWLYNRQVGLGPGTLAILLPLPVSFILSMRGHGT